MHHAPRSGLSSLLRSALLVPEAALILALLPAVLLSGDLIWRGALIGVICAFTLRTTLLRCGQRALLAGQFGRCRALLLVAQLMHPWSSDTIALRGALALRCGAAARAERLLLRAIALMPHSAASVTALSAALIEQGRAAEAVMCARRAIAIDQRCADAHYHLAHAETLLGHDPLVIELTLRQGMRCAANPDTYVTLGCALTWSLLEQERYAEAGLTLRAIEHSLPRCTPVYRTFTSVRIHTMHELLVA